MKTENQDPGYARRCIPMEYEDYIAQTFGYADLMDVPKNQFKKVKAVIKERFTQTGTVVRKLYGKKAQIVLRGDDETELDFAKRVDAYRIEDFAERFGKAMLKKSFPKGGFISEEDSFKVWMKTGYDQYEKKFEYKRAEEIPETGPEQIIDRSGKTRNAPDLKIETNQQWSPEELKNWLAKPEQQNRKAYVFREDRKFAMFGTSNDGENWTDTTIRNYSPDNWPADAPPYDSPEGWEYQKTMTQRNLKSMLTASWFEKQQTEKHALVAKRLREILAA